MIFQSRKKLGCTGMRYRRSTILWRSTLDNHVVLLRFLLVEMRCWPTIWSLLSGFCTPPSKV